MMSKFAAGASPLAALALAFALSGCAGGPQAAGQSRPAQYAYMNCGQLDAERQTLGAQIAMAEGEGRQRLQSQDVALQRAFSYQQCYRYASL